MVGYYLHFQQLVTIVETNHFKYILNLLFYLIFANAMTVFRTKYDMIVDII